MVILWDNWSLERDHREMALEAVSVQQELFGHNTVDLCYLLGGNWSNEFALGLAQKEEEGGGRRGGGGYCSFNNNLENQTENFLQTTPLLVDPHMEQWLPNSSSSEFPELETSKRAKRRRSKSKKNREEMENQRMTHITVERNRRKQMNEYLKVLRGLMPDSYVQRGDQASIVGGAINYVKELEQKLQCLVGTKHMNQKFEARSSSSSASASASTSSTFAEFFSFPQYLKKSPELSQDDHWAMADIEVVTMVERHANIKIRSKRQPKQLLKIVSGLQRLRLTILHLNVTTVDQIVLYSLSVKVEDECKLTTVDEIAGAMNQMLGTIQPED